MKSSYQKLKQQKDLNTYILRKVEKIRKSVFYNQLDILYLIPKSWSVTAMFALVSNVSPGPLVS